MNETGRVRPWMKKDRDRERERKSLSWFRFFLMLSYKHKHKAPRLRSYQYVNGEEGRYHKQYGDFFPSLWHEFRVLVHNSIFFSSVCLCVHVPSAVANDFQHTTLAHPPTQMYIYQFSFWRGVNWSHIKYPIFYTNWAFGADFFLSFRFFLLPQRSLYTVLYKYWIRNVNRRCCCTNDKIVDIEIYSNLCTGHTNCGRDTIAQELLRVPMKMISLSLQTSHL